MEALRQRTEYHRDPRLRALARDQECALLIAGWMADRHFHDRRTCVWAHSNLAEHGKGGRIKAHDCFGFIACAACHHQIDQGTLLNRVDRRQAQRDAMLVTRRYLVDHHMIECAEWTPALLTEDAEWLQAWQTGRIKVAR